MEYLLGIDVGSSSAKVGLIAPDGALAALAVHAYPTDEPGPHYKEQDPEGWWRAVVLGIREVLAIAQGDVVAVASTGHISSLTFLDAGNRPIRPAIGFQDLRAVAEVEKLGSEFSREELAGHLGIDLPPAATWPLPRLLWLNTHEPRTLERAHSVLQAKDYMNLRLTAELASDRSSCRGIVSQTTGRVPQDVFSRFGLPADLVPPLRDAASVMGQVTEHASRETGLPAGLPVVTGTNDLNACLLGSGCVESGQTFNLTGTSEHAGVVTAERHSDPALIYGPYVEGLKLFYGVTSSGGGSLEWFRNAFSYSLDDLLRDAATAPAGSDGLVFLPYLQGERAPIWDPSASGAFVGIRGQTRAHFARALMEGVAFSLRHNLEAVEKHTGVRSASIVISGGSARLPLWNQIKADVFERSIRVPSNPHVGVTGAAVLAAVGTRRKRNYAEATASMVQLQDPIEPSLERAAVYQEAYCRYRQLYPALKPWFAGNGRKSNDS